MNPLIKIAAYTFRDQLRQKSVYVLLGMSILSIWMIRGCYDAGITVNGKTIDTAALAWQMSKIVFHLVTAGMMLMAILLAMRIFSRDEADGSLVLFLSRSVSRWQYVLGRVVGTWTLCLVILFSLHLTLCWTVWAKTGSLVTEYLSASLVCSVTLLFVVACGCLLSLYLPDVMSALFTLGILFVGFISDGGYQLINSDAVRPFVSSAIDLQSALKPALWRVIYPKVFMVEVYADTLIGNGDFHPMGPVHPLLNLLCFIFLLLMLLLVGFNQKEI